MRISRQERDAIREAVARHFGPHTRVSLFGSRVDDHARGGDIDLFLDGVSGSADDVLRRKVALLVELHDRLGDQRIDLVIRRQGGPALPIHDVAAATGVPL